MLYAWAAMLIAYGVYNLFLSAYAANVHPSERIMPSSLRPIRLRLPPGSSLASQLNSDLIEHLPVGVYLCDQFGVLVAYNRKAAEIWGEEPELGDTQLKFCGAHKLLTPTGVHVPHEETPLATVLVAQKAVVNFSTIVERRDGTRVPVLANIVPLFDDSGVMIGFMNAVQDQRFQESQAQERARLEEALVQSQKMETIGQLTSGLAHDFNNQLSSVVLAVQLMKQEIEDSGSEKLLHRLRLAEKAIERATSLADNLLRFSRHRPREMNLVSPNEVVQSMHDLLRAALGGASKFTLMLASDIGYIRTNVAQLESSLLNLALNARDASVSGTNLIISTENVWLDAHDQPWGSSENSGGYIRISMSDNGCGMSQDTIDKIFTPFFTTKEAGKGTGLGLAMVKGFVSDMGGKLEVESTVGQGTTMHLYFPRAEEF